MEQLLAELTDAIRETVFPSSAAPEPEKQEEPPQEKEEEPESAAGVDESGVEPENARACENDDLDDAGSLTTRCSASLTVIIPSTNTPPRTPSGQFLLTSIFRTAKRLSIAAKSIARETAAAQQKKVDPQYHARIARTLDRFERLLASWYDRRNAAEASCPSILIVGAGNFPAAKHAKNGTLERLYKERDKIFELLNRLEGVGTSGIRSDDANAIEKLEEKLAQLLETHEEMKRANAYLRRNGSWKGYDNPEFVEKAYDSQGVPSYFYLTNSNQEARRIESRIALLKRQAATDYGDGWEFEGGVAKVSKEENRLQIFFDAVPDSTTRTKLKERGFRWSPRNKAWQRQLSPDAIWAGKF